MGDTFGNFEHKMNSLVDGRLGGNEAVPSFGGKPGELVPAVNPDDIKAVFKLHKDVQSRNPGKNFFIGARVMERVSKPGVDMKAIAYRTNFLNLWYRTNPDELTPWTQDGAPGDSVFRAIAQVKMTWMAVGVQQQGPPFDMEEFFRIVRGEG